MPISDRIARLEGHQVEYSGQPGCKMADGWHSQDMRQQAPLDLPSHAHAWVEAHKVLMGLGHPTLVFGDVELVDVSYEICSLCLYHGGIRCVQVHYIQIPLASSRDLYGGSSSNGLVLRINWLWGWRRSGDIPVVGVMKGVDVAVVHHVVVVVVERRDNVCFRRQY